jgi:hypothetical protein
MRAVAPDAELKARILASVRGMPSPTRGQARWSTGIIVAAATLLAAVLYVASDGPSHGAGRSPVVFASTMSVWIVAGFVSLWVAVGKGRAPMGRPAPWLTAVAVGMPVLVFFAMLALSVVVPGSGAAQIHRPGVACFSMTLAAASLPVLGLILARRRSDALHAAAHGAALGAAFGAYAGIMVCMWCPDISPLHIAVGHVAPLAVLASVGAVVGARVLALRPAK